MMVGFIKGIGRSVRNLCSHIYKFFFGTRIKAAVIIETPASSAIISTVSAASLDSSVLSNYSIPSSPSTTSLDSSRSTSPIFFGKQEESDFERWLTLANKGKSPFGPDAQIGFAEEPVKTIGDKLEKIRREGISPKPIFSESFDDLLARAEAKVAADVAAAQAEVADKQTAKELAKEMERTAHQALTPIFNRHLEEAAKPPMAKLRHIAKPPIPMAELIIKDLQEFRTEIDTAADQIWTKAPSLNAMSNKVAQMGARFIKFLDESCPVQNPPENFERDFVRQNMKPDGWGW